MTRHSADVGADGITGGCVATRIAWIRSVAPDIATVTGYPTRRVSCWLLLGYAVCGAYYALHVLGWVSSCVLTIAHPYTDVP